MRITKKVKRFLTPIPEAVVGNYILKCPRRYRADFYAERYPDYEKGLKDLAVSLQEKYKGKGLIVDIGACIGDTIALLKTNGITNKIMAIEGDSDIYEMLLDNISLFDGDIETQWLWLSNDNDIYYCNFKHKGGSSKIVYGMQNTIHTVRFDDLCMDDNIVLFKIDAEGFDVKILEGAMETLKKHQPIIYFEFDNPKEDYIFKQLYDIGYKHCIFYDNYGNKVVSLENDFIFDVDKNQFKKVIKYYDVTLFTEKDFDIYNTIK